MLGRYIFESLRRIPELKRFEDEVFVDPVMGLLVERVVGEGVADVEDVAVDFLGGLRGQVLCPEVVGCWGVLVAGEMNGRGVGCTVEDHVANPAEGGGDEEVLVHGGMDVVGLSYLFGVLFAEFFREA